MNIFSVKRHIGTGEKTDRKKADTKLNQKTSFLELTACVLSSSQDTSFKHSLMVVLVSKFQFQCVPVKGRFSE